MYGSHKKPNKPVKLFLKTPATTAKKKSKIKSIDKEKKPKEQTISPEININKHQDHENNLKEIELLKKELNDIVEQNESISNELITIKKKQNDINDEYKLVNENEMKENNELNELKELYEMKNREYLSLCHLRIRQQINNSIFSVINHGNSLSENNTNERTGDNRISDIFTSFNLLMNLSRLRRINEELNNALISIQSIRNNNNEEGPAMSYTQLQNLPSSNYKKRNNTTEKCTICRLKFDYNDVITKLNCHHVFHKNCLVNRLSNTHSSKCPTCKASII